MTDHAGYPQPLPRVASGALAQLWRQALLDERSMSRDLLRTVARPVSWTAFDTGLSVEELILGVTTSWTATDALHRVGATRLPWIFARLLSLCVDEFQFALRASEARARDMDHLQRHEPQPAKLGLG